MVQRYTKTARACSSIASGNPGKRVIWLFFALLGHFSPPLGAQNTDSMSLVLRLPVPAVLAAADHLNQLYTVQAGGLMEKYSPEGKYLSRYSNNRLGAPSAIDVSNPLKIVLWFADFRMAVLLDRNLTELGQIDLIAAGIPEVRTLASSRDGHFWVYDEVAFRLKKIDASGQLLLESPPLNTLIPEKITFRRLFDDGNRLYAWDEERGLWMFDPYGQWLDTRASIRDEQFQIGSGYFYFLHQDMLRYEPLRPGPVREQALPDSARLPGARCWLAPERLLVQHGNFLEVFHL
jgi:hypothetical protein